MSAAPEAVFIGGCPRSGTTLLASLLGGLPGCVVTPESQFKQSPLRRLQRDPSATLSGAELLAQWRCHFRFRQWQVPLEPADLPGRLGPEELRRLLLELARRSGARQGLAAGTTAPTTWIDHTPQNIEIGLALSRCFPSAKLIEIVRDPRAVAASLLPLDWGPMAPAGVAALWSHRLAHGLALQQALGERIRRVRYEDLCRDPDGTLGALADWLGLEPPMAAAAGGGPDAVAPALPLQPVSGFLPAYTRHQHGLIGSRPRSDRIDAWRGQLQPWQQADLEERLGELMLISGYLPDPPAAATQRRAGLWRRQLQPLLRTVQGRLRHRWRQRRHSGGLG